MPVRPSLLSALASGVLFASGATAQCTSAIPSNATVLHAGSPTDFPLSGGTFWVCADAGETLFRGNTQSIHAEQGSVIRVSGNYSTVRSDGTVRVSGSSNTIYARAGSVFDSGSGNNITYCASVVFDYGTAPPQGCAMVGITGSSLTVLRTYPNPASDYLFIDPGTARVHEVRVLDATGREVARHRGTDLRRIGVSGLASGAYVVRIATDAGTVVRRVAKR